MLYVNELAIAVEGTKLGCLYNQTIRRPLGGIVPLGVGIGSLWVPSKVKQNSGFTTGNQDLVICDFAV